MSYECSTLRDMSHATAIIAEILGCRESDTPEIFRLCHLHGRGVIDRANVCRKASRDRSWTFAVFIEGVGCMVLDEIRNSITARQFQTLQSIKLDTEPGAWFSKDGGIADNGDAFCNEAVIFENMCRYGITGDRLQALIEAGRLDEI